MAHPAARITVTVPADDLTRAVRAHGSGKTGAVVRALKVANFLDAALRDGKKLMLQDTDGTLREVEFV